MARSSGNERGQAGPIFTGYWSVSFEPVDGSINDRVDEAYRAKYHKVRISNR